MSRALRTPPDIRRRLILEAAIEVSIKVGYAKITRDSVAEIAGVASSLIARYFPRMIDLRDAVLEAAIEGEIVEILAQGLTIRDPRVTHIDKKLKEKVMHHLFDSHS